MRCTATYVDKSPDGTILFLKDGDGPVNMTNDAEAVVTLCHEQNPGLRIVYRDTDGVWGELLHDGAGLFGGFASYVGWLPNESS